MTLTTGATLQEGRYVIQGILTKDALGTTYQALHAQLDQPVVIQSVDADRVPQDAEKTTTAKQAVHLALKQRQKEFVVEVRRRFKAQSPIMSPIVDCFIERETPFVVLLLPEGTQPPAISDWLPLKEVSAKPEVKTAIAPQTVTQPPVNPVQKEPASVPSQPTAHKAVLQPAISTPQPSLTPLIDGTTAFVAMPLNVKTYQKQTYPASKPHRRRWLPIGLLCTALVGGIGGATMGWAIRTERIARPGQAPLLEPLLNNEQAFPPLENWSGDDPTGDFRRSTPEASSDLTPYRTQRETRQEPEDYFPEPLPEWEAPRVRRREAVRQEEFVPPLEVPAPQELPPVEMPPEPAAEVLPPEAVDPPPVFKPAPEELPPPEPPAIAPPAEPPVTSEPTLPPPVTQ